MRAWSWFDIDFLSSLRPRHTCSYKYGLQFRMEKVTHGANRTTWNMVAPALRCPTLLHLWHHLFLWLHLVRLPHNVYGFIVRLCVSSVLAEVAGSFGYCFHHPCLVECCGQLEPTHAQEFSLYSVISKPTHLYWSRSAVLRYARKLHVFASLRSSATYSATRSASPSWLLKNYKVPRCLSCPADSVWPVSTLSCLPSVRYVVEGLRVS